MKKLSILMLVLAFLLCGCGKDNPKETAESNEPLYYIETEEYGYIVYDDYVELKEFFGSASETVAIPEMFYDSVAEKDKPLTVIGNTAFNADSGARYLVIPDSVTEIGTGAFRGCSGIETLTLSKNLKLIGSSAFSGCTSIREITIPDSVQYIGDSAFEKCATAEKITLGKGVSEIGDSAFSGCLSAETVTGGEGLAFVGENAFARCPWFEKLSDEFAGIGSVLLKYNGSEAVVSVPESFRSVADAFKGKDITSVSFPEGFESIGNYAFSGCGALADVSVPKTVTRIGNDAFSGTPYLSELTSDDGYCIVGDGVLLKFMGDSSGVTIPETVKYISDAFSGNENISEVRIGDNVKAIGRDAFENCPELAIVIMSKSVEYIDEYAFYGSDVLEFNASGNKYAAKWAKDYGLNNIIE